MELIKNKSYKLFTIGILFLGIVLSFNACQDEEIQQDLQQAHTGANPNQVSLDFFKSVTEIKNLDAFAKQGLNQIQNGYLARNSDTAYELSDFYIDTDVINQYILNDQGDLSFSFKIHFLDDNYIPEENYNLVIQKDINDQWAASIYLLIENTDTNSDNYFSSIERIYHSNDLPAGVLGRSGSGFTLMCGDTYTFNCQGCTGACDLCSICVSVTVTCEMIYISGPEEHNNNSLTDPSFNYNGGGGGGSSNTADYLDDLKDECIADIASELGLSTAESDCLSNNSSFSQACGLSNDVSNYLAENQVSSNPNGGLGFAMNSPEAIAFANTAIEAICNGGEVDFDKKIINNLTGKAKCIYKKIAQQNGVRKALDRFQSTSSPANLILENASLGNYFGNTISPDANDLITIQLNSDSGFWGVDYQPNVLVAQTIFHEIIHAEFFRQIVIAIGAGNYNGATVQEVINALENSNYATLYEYYRTYNDWSHNFMADYYRDTIARVTQEYATGVAVPDNEQPQQLYIDLAWKGLRGDGFIVAWDQLTEDEKQAIDNTINNFTTNNSNQICIE